MNPKVIVLLGCMVLAGCGKKKVAEKNLLTNNNSGNPVTAAGDYVGAVNQARKFAIKRVDIAQLQNAISLFNGQEDRFPRDLNELVAKHYIQAIPPLPAGSRYAYNPQTGDIRVVQQ